MKGLVLPVSFGGGGPRNLLLVLRRSFLPQTQISSFCKGLLVSS